MVEWYENGKELRDVRKRLGLTQKDLADRAGVKRTTISDFELGHRPLHGRPLPENVRNKIWEALAKVDIERRKHPGLVPMAELLESDPGSSRSAGHNAPWTKPGHQKLVPMRGLLFATPQDEINYLREKVDLLQKMIDERKNLDRINNDLIDSFKGLLAEKDQHIADLRNELAKAHEETKAVMDRLSRAVTREGEKILEENTEAVPEEEQKHLLK